MKKTLADLQKDEVIALGLRLKALRLEYGMSLSAAAVRLQNEFGAAITRGMIYKYESGAHKPSAATLYCLSQIYRVSTEYLLGETDDRTPTSSTEAAGSPGYCLKLFTSMNDVGSGEQDGSTSVIIPKSWLYGGKSYFAYRVTGRRFAPRYYDGDILIFQNGIKAQPTQTALVSIGGEPAILCFVTRKRGGKEIIPLDPTCESRFFTTAELSELPVRILGVCIQLQRQEFDL